jgi:chemotaxis protein MotB
MVTMGDMNNLLMCFFIVMMGDITTVSEENFQMMISSFKGGLGMLEGGSSLSKGRLMELGQNMTALPSTEKAKQLSRAMRKAVEIFKPEIKSKLLRVREDERGLVITLFGDAYFDTGSARLRDDIKPVLKKVGDIIKSTDRLVRIEGHTDNRQIPPAGVREGYSSNWELSSSRSINILRHLAEEEDVDPKQMSAVAYGQYRPIDDNNTPEGRAYNRRVEIVILRDRGAVESKNSEIDRPLPDEEWR